MEESPPSASASSNPATNTANAEEQQSLGAKIIKNGILAAVAGALFWKANEWLSKPPSEEDQLERLFASLGVGSTDEQVRKVAKMNDEIINMVQAQVQHSSNALGNPQVFVDAVMSRMRRKIELSDRAILMGDESARQELMRMDAADAQQRQFEEMEQAKWLDWQRYLARTRLQHAKDRASWIREQISNTAIERDTHLKNGDPQRSLSAAHALANWEEMGRHAANELDRLQQYERSLR